MNKMRLAETVGDIAELGRQSAAEQSTTLPPNAFNRPSYGDPQREAINSVIDGLVDDICKDIAAVRTLLNEVEQQVLEGAAKAKHSLQEQVGVCTSVKDEITHMRRVVADIQEREKALQQ